jgi:hypothetical protein
MIKIANFLTDSVFVCCHLHVSPSVFVLGIDLGSGTHDIWNESKFCSLSEMRDDAQTNGILAELHYHAASGTLAICLG